MKETIACRSYHKKSGGSNCRPGVQLLLVCPFAGSIEDDGTFVDRWPSGLESFEVVTLDTSERSKDIAQQQQLFLSPCLCRPHPFYIG